jgi:hypothetical protein
VALSAEKGAASDLRLPAPSKLRPGRLVRDEDGSILAEAGAARVLSVCPAARPRPDCVYQGLAGALASAQPGDEILLTPGIYEEAAVVAVDAITLRGQPGAHLKGHAAEGKAALVIRGDDVVIDGIECSGIEVGDRNGACIRIEGDDLTVRNVNFHDNENGILGGPGGGTVLIENSRFERNGRDGRAHGVYIAATVERLVFRNNEVLSTKEEGHGVKSRAQRTVIEGNVIAGLDGKDSRAIDIPNGGEVVIRGNILEKGPNSANREMIGLALEGDLHPANDAVVEGNLILFDTITSSVVEAINTLVEIAPRRGQVINSKSPGGVALKDNVIVGAREIGLGGPDVGNGNVEFASRRAAELPAYPVISRDLLAATRSQ